MIDLGFEFFLTLSYAWEPAEDTDLLMSVPPRKPVTLESTMNVFNIAKQKETIKRSQFDLRERNDIRASSMYLNLNNQEQEHDGDLIDFGTSLKKKYETHVNEMKTLLTQKNYWTEEIREWRSITSQPSGERLVDGEVMLWSYAEAGLIEFFGCMCTYFAIFWFSFGVTAGDARMGQLIGSKHWKPQSPDLILQNGNILVFSINKIEWSGPI